MDNYSIADNFSLLSKLMDIHGENSFKSKSYASAAFAIEKLPVQLAEIEKSRIPNLNGIGVSTAQKIVEQLETGNLKALEEIISKTPKGIIEMLTIKGIGPKKINTIWKEMEIETIGELLYACKENRLKLYKGFGEKTQQNVIEKIEFYFKHKDSHLFYHAEAVLNVLWPILKNIFASTLIEITGAFKRQLEILDELEFVIAATASTIIEKLSLYEDFTLKQQSETYLIFSSLLGMNIKIYFTEKEKFIDILVETSSSTSFWKDLNAHSLATEKIVYIDEMDFFTQRRLPYLPAYLRDDFDNTVAIESKGLNAIIQIENIKGIIHSHSNWSDGSNTIEEMAIAAIKMGFEYLVISDHSKSAFYAQGLSEEKIFAQHKMIDDLNVKLHPFKIFKSIESDILNDGNLDYDNNTLKTFDLIIASVHSNLKMNEEKAMMRLMKAIENPYTTILGHMTGRLLLSRPGYPVDHKKIIDACASNNVAIELNANPNRLDIDWRNIDYALKKNVLISINPDAHQIEGMNDVKYGVLVAQKALVTKEQNLSSFSLELFEKYIQSK
jgi:DNA polymerase (family 10)